MALVFKQSNGALPHMPFHNNVAKHVFLFIFSLLFEQDRLCADQKPIIIYAHEQKAESFFDHCYTSTHSSTYPSSFAPLYTNYDVLKALVQLPQFFRYRYNL